VLLIEGYAGMISLGENYQFRVLAVIDPAPVHSDEYLRGYQFTKDAADLLAMTARRGLLQRGPG
jgi:hypothetical protein